VPSDEIWVLKEVHRCDVESTVKSNRSDLQIGKKLGCRATSTYDHNFILNDLIINNKCLRANGILVSDGPLQKYSKMTI
jgi:hypothetical protein